ncbi:MAG: PIN domain nuclease [Gammaproteobacteria bacterium]|nr:PIN domain nuclease [Gammaproteobacteria bacterium]
MIVVDTSVWVDYFNGRETPQVVRLDALLGERILIIGDLILAELLQGFADERDARRALNLLQALDQVQMVGGDVAVESARLYRLLRRKGVTIRKTMDMLIGTFCLLNDHELLHADRDFDVLARHAGLRVHQA